MSASSDDIMNDGDAQMMLTDAEGDISEANDFIDDVDYIQAMEMVDDALEKLTTVRKYLEGKIN